MFWAWLHRMPKSGENSVHTTAKIKFNHCFQKSPRWYRSSTSDSDHSLCKTACNTFLLIPCWILLIKRYKWGYSAMPDAMPDGTYECFWAMTKTDNSIVSLDFWIMLSYILMSYQQNQFVLSYKAHPFCLLMLSKHYPS